MEELVYRFRWQALVFLLGSILVGSGILISGLVGSSDSGVEIIEPDEAEDGAVLVVEVSGAVTEPGVYELLSGSRVDDAINAAKGFSDEVDMESVELIMNRASRLVDGQKVYVPKQGDPSSANILGGSSGVSTTINSRVNVNTASTSELEELWGIGPKTAQNIIEQRPYSRVEELSEKGILKSNVFERNKDVLSVY